MLVSIVRLREILRGSLLLDTTTSMTPTGEAVEEGNKNHQKQQESVVEEENSRLRLICIRQPCILV